jgi:outer membrane protein assembly factor BamA
MWVPSPGRVSCVTSLLLFSFACSAAFAQTPESKPPARGKIAEVHATGSKRYPEVVIVAASGLKPGDVVGPEELQAAADRLAALGPLANVRYRFTSKGEALNLEFLLDDAPTIPVWFDNFPWFTDEELTAGIKQAVSLFDGTAPEQGALLGVMTDALQRMLASRGVKASVDHNVVAEPGGDKPILEFQVVAPILSINAVQFGDAIAAESKKLKERLSDLVGKPYSRFSIAEFISENVNPLYAEQGYLRAKIGPPETRFTGDPAKPLPDNVLVIIPIAPGPVYHWAGLEWTKDGPASKSFLDPLIPLKNGDLANGTVIIGFWHNVEDVYAAHGFLEAKVDPHPVFDDAAARVSYRVEITAGPRYHMGEMVITGLSVAAEKKLRAEFPIPRGQAFDRVAFDQFLDAGLKRVFADSPVHYDKVGHLLQTHPENQTVDVLLDFQ